MTYNIGLNVVEVDGRATPSIQAAPTSVTGFIIRSQRGLPGKVVQVTNWSQFVEHFGSYIAEAYGAYAVRGFFDNGGTIAYVTRVVNTTPGTATAPSITSSEGPWILTPGDTLIFKTNLPGSPFKVTFDATEATLVGLAGTYNLATAESNGIDISIDVNGVLHDPYQFQAEDFDDLGHATAAEVAAVLNREFPGIRAWVDADDELLRVRTDRRGTGASLLAGGEAAPALGFDDDGEVKGGGNVADIDEVTPPEAVALVKAVLSPDRFVVTEDNGRVHIQHPNTGIASTLQVDPNSTAVAAFGFDTEELTGTDSDPAAAASAATATLTLKVDNVEIYMLTVTAGYRGVTDVGAWGNLLRVETAVNSENASLFDLIVQQNDAVVETWTGLSMEEGDFNFVEKRINDEFAGSKYIIVKATGITNQPVEAATHLAGGNNGAWDSTAELNAYAAAVDLFDLIDIQLLTCPETHEKTVVEAALRHCGGKGDRMFVGHAPYDCDARAAKDFVRGKGFRGDKVYGALYFPWIRVADPLGGQKWIPPTGHIAGVYARTERERGIWKAPAGNAARVNGALDVRYHITDADHTDLVKNGSVNAIRSIPGQGIVIDSSRTLSTNPLWLYVNVRLLFNFVKSSLKSGLRWVVQEPNDETLWNKVKFNSVTPFLTGLWRRGAFGPGAAEEVFTVKIDAENNPPASIQQGILTLEVYFYPSRPAETIVITIGQQEGGASASEKG